jgi:positive regulator of sigma E activity
VWIKVCHGEYCGGCGLHSPEDEFVEVEVRDPLGTRVGDKIEFESDTPRMIRTVFLVFWFPLISAGLLAWAGWLVFAALGLAQQLGAVLLGLFGVTCAIVAVRGVERRTEAGAGLTVVRIVPADELLCSPPDRAWSGEEHDRIRNEVESSNWG